MENLDYDALRLIGKILGDTFEDNILVHISQTEYVVYSFPASAEIPSCYGYIVDRTPEYLEKKGVLKILLRNQYAVNDFRQSTIPQYQRPMIEFLAEQAGIGYKNFTKKTRDFSHYSFYAPALKNIAVSAARGLCFVVVNRKRAMKWMDDLKLKERQRVSFPEERPYWYEMGQLHFRLADGSTDQLDFSKAPISRKIFEAFWSLWVTDNKGEYTAEEIVKKYKEIHRETFEASKVGERVSNARTTIVNRKVTIRDRVVWEYNKTSNKWIFKLS